MTCAWGFTALALAESGSATARRLVLVLAYRAGPGIPFVALALLALIAVLQLVGGEMLLTGLLGQFIAWPRGPIASYTLTL